MAVIFRRPPARPAVIDGGEPAVAGMPSAEWSTPDLAVMLLFRVPPTDRALAGWDPGYWHLPERED